MGTEIFIKRPDGTESRGYLTLAAKSDAPGVVVIQEWWGLQDQVKGLCDRFAAAGFSALAPDLYNGEVVPYHDRERAGEAMNSLDFGAATGQAVKGAVDYLAQNGAKVGIVGFCMGGAVAILGAAKLEGLSAAVSYYGLPPEEAATPAEVKIPLMGHFANRDDWASPAAADAFEAGLKKSGKEFEFFRYDAEHAFANEQRLAAHDRKAAELAWGRTLGFLSRHLA
jgi:carboxymethylenebutenolidase